MLGLLLVAPAALRAAGWSATNKPEQRQGKDAASATEPTRAEGGGRDDRLGTGDGVRVAHRGGPPEAAQPFGSHAAQAHARQIAAESDP